MCALLILCGALGNGLYAPWKDFVFNASGWGAGLAGAITLIALVLATERRAKRDAGQVSPTWLKALSIVVLVVDIIGLLVLCVTVISSKNKFAQMFSEMGVGDIQTLPGLTLLMIAVPTAAYVLAFGSLMLVLVAKEFAIRKKAITLGLNSLALALGMAFLGIYITSMFLPLVKIMGTMQKANGEGTGVPVAASEQSISWGQPVNGLQIGLGVSSPRGEAGAPLKFDIHYKNVGDREFSFHGEWRLSIRSKGFGYEKYLPVNVLGLSKDATDLSSYPCPEGVPAGAYTVLATLECTENSEPSPYWHGKVTTGHVGIEIVEPGKE